MHSSRSETPLVFFLLPETYYPDIFSSPKAHEPESTVMELHNLVECLANKKTEEAEKKVELFGSWETGHYGMPAINAEDESKPFESRMFDAPYFCWSDTQVRDEFFQVARLLVQYWLSERKCLELAYIREAIQFFVKFNIVTERDLSEKFSEYLTCLETVCGIAFSKYTLLCILDQCNPLSAVLFALEKFPSYSADVFEKSVDWNNSPVMQKALFALALEYNPQNLPRLVYRYFGRIEAAPRILELWDKYGHQLKAHLPSRQDIINAYYFSHRNQTSEWGKVLVCLFEAFPLEALVKQLGYGLCFPEREIFLLKEAHKEFLKAQNEKE